MKTRPLIAMIAGAALAALASSVALARPSVDVVPVVRGRAVEAVYATGTVEVDSRAAIRAKVGGTVVAVPAQEGDPVRAGDALVTLDNRTLTHALAGAKAELAAAKVSAGAASPQLATVRANGGALQAQLALAQADLKRTQALVKSGAISPAEADRARAHVSALGSQVASNRAQQRSMKLELDTNASLLEQRAKSLDSDADGLRAPFDGTVLKRHVAPGETVTPNQLLVELGDTRNLVVMLSVDEDEISKVEEGARVAVTLTAFRDRVFRCRVARILPEPDRSRRSYSVKLVFDEATAGVRNGMSATANVVVHDEGGALLVPTKAVDGDSVWVAKRGRLEKRRVVVGTRDFTFAQILSGVDEGEEVVLQPTKKLEPRARVVAVVKPPPPRDPLSTGQPEERTASARP